MVHPIGSKANPGSAWLEQAELILAKPNENFFDYLVEWLEISLDCDVAMVVDFTDKQFFVLAGRRQYKLLTGDRGLISRSPFSDTLSYAYCLDELDEFSQDCEWLQNPDINHALIVPLLDTCSNVLGAIALFNQEKFLHAEAAQKMLSVFVAKAASVLEERRQKNLLASRQERYQVLIDRSQNGMFVVDIEPPMPIAQLSFAGQQRYLKQHAKFSQCNPSFLLQLGELSEQDVIGKSIPENEQIYNVDEIISQFIGSHYNLEEKEYPFIGHGETRWYSTCFSGRVVEGQLTQIYGISSDVTERVRQTELLAYQTKHDELTQLPNRSFFKAAVDEAITSLASDQELALFILDLDGFKEVNDTLGHLTGDQLLTKIGPRLTTVLDAENTIISRLGGDEFGILLTYTVSTVNLTDIAILIVSAIKTPFSVQDLDLRIGGSIGISCYPEHGSDFTSLMRCADIAMYRAKETSKDFEVYQSEADHFSVRRLSLMMDMRHAVEDDQLELYYQPITDINSKAIKGFEALVRWHHPEHGLIPPGEFIPLIELTDTIEPLTWWVIETAVKQLRNWQQEGKPYTLSVNVSTRNIGDDSFVYRLSKLLRKYKVDSRYLEIEITESTLMSDPEKGRSVLNALSRMGVKFSIDDYGTGYSSLAYLKSLPIHTLKIDRAFIANMLSDEQDQIIVKSTIQLAHNLGMQVTAEGIEDYRLIAVLRDLGCNFGQGYFICRPLPFDNLAEWINLYERGQLPISSLN